MKIKLKSRNMYIPRLFWGNGVATMKMALLRACEHPKGYRLKRYKIANYWDSGYSLVPSYEARCMNELYHLGWVQMEKLGPRGGARWRPTELGQIVLDIVRQAGPNYHAQFLLLFG